MKQGWHSILRPGVQGNSTSFIGGKPCLPPSIPLPVCKICGEPLTSFFQVAFPEGHIWTGKSLAFFFCSSYQEHESGSWMPPEIHPAENGPVYHPRRRAGRESVSDAISGDCIRYVRRRTERGLSGAGRLSRNHLEAEQEKSEISANHFGRRTNLDRI